MGTEEQWEKAEAALTEALERQGREYELNPGDGAFYGPKIDFHVTDALGRSWQCGTCQLDFQMPERFDLTYVGADDAPHRPVMIHRALLGSMERFAGILIEHYAGRFPVWLAPVQAIVLPVSDRHNAYAERVAAELREAGVRVAVGRALRVGRQEGPRRRAGPLPLHAGGRRPRAEAGAVARPLARRGRAGGDAAGRVRRPRRAESGAFERRRLPTAALPLYCAHLIAGTPNTARR